MSCALLDLFKTVITNAYRKVLHGKQIRSTGLELNGKIRDQRDDLIRRRMEMKNIYENQLLGLQSRGKLMGLPSPFLSTMGVWHHPC